MSGWGMWGMRGMFLTLVGGGGFFGGGTIVLPRGCHVDPVGILAVSGELPQHRDRLAVADPCRHVVTRLK